MHHSYFRDAKQCLTEIYEDVGRHSALDKFIGAVPDYGTGPIVLTSRVSVEMAQKTVMAGASVILVVSTPTTLAVTTADTAVMTLIVLAGDDTIETFTHPNLIQSNAATHAA